MGLWGSYMPLPSPERDEWEARLAALVSPDTHKADAQ